MTDSAYYNAVIDSRTKQRRSATKTENLIAEYCLAHSSHLNAVCFRLGSCRYENRPYSSDDLIYAAKSVYKRLTTKKYDCPYDKDLIETIKLYLRSHDIYITTSGDLR